MSPAAKRVDPPVVTFLYHEVCEDPAQSGFQRRSALPYKHRPTEFEKNLDVIGTVAPTPVALSDLRNDSNSEYKIILTFDDGGKSALHIADTLDRRGWPGHFFVTTSMIGTRTFLDPGEIRELHARGHGIGSHSHTHPAPFNSLTIARMHEEWRVSREILEDILGETVTSASVPGGDLSTEVLESAADSGIRFLFTSEPLPRAWAYGEMLCFGRVCPKAGTPLKRVERLASNRGFTRELVLRSAKNSARTVLRPLYVRWAANVHGERQSS